MPLQIALHPNKVREKMALIGIFSSWSRRRYPIHANKAGIIYSRRVNYSTQMGGIKLEMRKELISKGATIILAGFRTTLYHKNSWVYLILILNWVKIKFKMSKIEFIKTLEGDHHQSLHISWIMKVILFSIRKRYLMSQMQPRRKTQSPSKWPLQ